MVTILVADDSAFSRLNCKKALKPTGYDIVEAETGTQAVELFQSSSPDAVLLDVTMPGMDGISALKKILEIDSTARIAMVSAMGQQAVVIDALKSGAKDFVVKPFDSERVLATVEKLLA